MAALRRFLSLLALSASLTGCAGAMDDGDGSEWPPGAMDATQVFQTFRSRDEADQDQIFKPIRDRLRQQRVLLVPSIQGDPLGLARGGGLTDFTDTAEIWLTEERIPAIMAGVGSDLPPERNAEHLRDFVGYIGAPVCFLSHGRGGLDVLAFLLSATPEERKKIACWIALQAPFGGSPLAAVDEQALPAETLAALGGGGDVTRAMTVQARRRVLASMDQSISEIVAEIPFLAVAGRIDPETQSGGVSDFTKHLNGAEGHDGIVPAVSAILPHGRYVMIDDLDHGMKGPEGMIARMLKSLFVVALLSAAP